MILKINGAELPVYPSKFVASSFDLDNGETTQRTIDGTLNRDRIAIKSQVEMEFGILKWDEVSTILAAVSDVFFNFYYPDPVAGGYVERVMYVGNRSTPIALFQGGQAYWSGLKLTFTEK